MRSRAKTIVRVLWSLVALFLIGGIWWYYFASPAPESRPDLVRLPDSIGEAPKGFPSRNALGLAFVMNRLPLIDLDESVVLPNGVKEEIDVEYGRVDDRPLLLDLYSPTQLDETVPAILFIHGGGWGKGDKNDYRMYTTHFAEQGYVVASVGYRLKQEAPYPAAVEDVKCAVRWVRAHAEQLNVDPERIAVIGGSAGGHLAMMVGYSSDVSSLEGNGGWAETSSSVCAVVDIYGPVDMTTEYARNHELITSFIGHSYENAPYLYEESSPLFHLDKTDPPTLIIQGTLDDLMPVIQSDRLAAALENLGIPYWYDRIDGWPHAMDLAKPVNDRVKEVSGAFFEEFLRDNGTDSAQVAQSPPKP